MPKIGPVMHEMVEDLGLSWPAAFLDKPRRGVLEATNEFLERVYGQ
jgi:hypothetical protein